MFENPARSAPRPSFETCESMGRARASGSRGDSFGFDPAEQRRYGGIEAKILAPLASRYIKLRRLNGVALFLEVFARLSDALINALYVYTKTKDALRGLNTEIVLQTGGGSPQARRAQPPTTKEGRRETLPRNWPDISAKLGYDPRLTTHKGVADQVRRLRRNAICRARKERDLIESITVIVPAGPASDAPKEQSRKEITSPPEPVYGEIWPPIALPHKINPPIRVIKRPEPDPEDQAQRDSRVLGYEGIYHDYNRGRTWAGAPIRERCAQQSRDPP